MGPIIYNKKQVLYFLLLFLLSMSIYLSAQSDLRCDYCDKKITGKYLEAEGRHFHPNHFKCSKCKKNISGQYAEKEGKFFHSGCYALSEGMVCSYCRKAVEGGYVESSGKKYHRKCYDNNIALKCDICKKTVTGEYSIDSYGNKFHTYHNKELDECDNCSRLISGNITGGGKTYSDGRHICSRCFSNAVFDNSRIKSMLGRVISRLESFGINLNEKNISIKGVDRKELKKAAGNSYSKYMRGFCLSSRKNEYINNRLSKTSSKYTIYVLNGVPQLNVESVIAHELMHVWLNENTKDNHSEELREGSCNYISYLYLRSVGNTEAKQVIKSLENNNDDVYGDGFRRVKSEFEGKGLKQLLNYLKTSRSV